MMADPLSASIQPSALVASVTWLEAIMTGAVAVSIAIIAIAATGVGMMYGRMDLRRGAATIFGCFVVFGAPSLANALMAIVPQAARYEPLPQSFAAPNPPAVSRPPSAKDYDPYAGAAMPAQ